MNLPLPTKLICRKVYYMQSSINHISRVTFWSHMQYLEILSYCWVSDTVLHTNILSSFLGISIQDRLTLKSEYYRIKSVICFRATKTLWGSYSIRKNVDNSNLGFDKTYDVFTRNKLTNVVVSIAQSLSLLYSNLKSRKCIRKVIQYHIYDIRL